MSDLGNGVITMESHTGIFRHRSALPCAEPAPTGDGFEPVFEEVSEDGLHFLREVSKNNVNDFVQASLSDTLIYNILDRYVRGDVNALNRSASGQYIDVVGMPSTLAEAQRILIDAEARFYSLPEDVRQKYDNDVNVFIEKVASGDVSAFVSPSSSEVEVVKVSDSVGVSSVSSDPVIDKE